MLQYIGQVSSELSYTSGSTASKLPAFDRCCLAQSQKPRVQAQHKASQGDRNGEALARSQSSKYLGQMARIASKSSTCRNYSGHPAFGRNRGSDSCYFGTRDMSRTARVLEPQPNPVDVVEGSERKTARLHSHRHVETCSVVSVALLFPSRLPLSTWHFIR